MKRIRVLKIGILFSFLCIIAALVFLQIIRGEYYRSQSRSNRIRVIPVEAPRGLIIARDGKVLAENRMAYHLAVVEQDVDDKTALFTYLGRILDKDPAKLLSIYDKRRVNPFTPVLVAEDVSSQVVFKVEENRFQYPGLMVLQVFARHYPRPEGTMHVIGYVGKVSPQDAWADYGYTPLTYVGKAGLEQYYDEWLRGNFGGRQIEINARGQQVRTIGLKEPQEGHRLDISIDADLSMEAQRLLGEQRGAVVMMDADNGEVLVMASAPSFNPNSFVDKQMNSQVTEYFTNPYAPMLNRAVNGQFPPGSVFKMPVALAALQSNKITPSQQFTCPGYLMLGGRKFGCAHVHGVQDLVGAIARSCNVYFFHTAQLLGAKAINAYARAFGFGRATGIDLPFEFPGSLRSLSTGNTFYGGDLLNLSIGQGDTLATPLQVTVLMAAIASDGFLTRPRLLIALDGKKIPGPDLRKRPRVRLRPDVWGNVKKGLALAVDDDEGTAHALKTLEGMKVWGKTGTAQAGKGKENHAWLAGYVKVQEHTYAFCVFLEHGGSSANAVNITKDYLTKMKEIKHL